MSTAPRRSARLATLPAVKYFTEEDEVIEILEKLCTKNGWIYTDELFQEYTEWSLANPGRSDWSVFDRVNTWSWYDSKLIRAQLEPKRDLKAILKYCANNNIEYNPAMLDTYQQWKADPANKSLITITYKPRKCTCEGCSVTRPPVPRSCSECVRKWFSTLKKTVEL